MTHGSRNSPLLRNVSLSAYPWRRSVAAEFTQRGIGHCSATVSENTHSCDNASLSTLVTAGLMRVPVTTHADYKRRIHELLDWVFWLRFARNYKGHVTDSLSHTQTAVIEVSRRREVNIESSTGVVSKMSLVRQTSFVQISHSGREDARSPGGNGARLRQSPILSCYSWLQLWV
jgi:hypothetical protein